MSFSDYWENVILDSILNATLYAGLSTADPGDDAAALAEPVGGGYARVQVTNATWATASGGSKANVAAVIFPEASDSWGTVTHFCLFDAATEGHLLISFALTSGVAVTVGKVARFAAGDLAVTLG